ncbi:MAG: elongation factor G [Alphaproteobacteria bacterium]|nr:elongation factor G [Alphaproteobacteria bacterium]
MTGALAAGTRCAALVGPYLSGKTTLLESLLFATGAIPRKGSVKEGNTVGDSAPESRDREMTTELSVAETEYLDDGWVFVDCPGSVELAQESFNALLAADAAIVVCEPAPERAVALAPLMRFLDAHAIPHIVFINKMDQATAPLQEVLEALQGAAARPLVLRQVPIRDGEAITGYVDLVSERAYEYKPGEPSAMISIPETVSEEEAEARQTMLEALADFDDELLEKLLEETVPPSDEIYEQCRKDLREGLIVPVFLGAAEHDHGVRRLLKALRHEVPSPAATAGRKGIAPEGEPCAQVFKSLFAAHTGKLSIARVWRGEIKEGETMGGVRIGGIARLLGNHQKKVDRAGLGDVVALQRMDECHTGDFLTPSGKPPEGTEAWPEPMAPVYSIAIEAANRSDEVKLTGALQRLHEEDPSLSYRQDNDVHQLILFGQGEIHLQIAIARLKGKFNVGAVTAPPQVPYKETIQKSVSQHARFKRQTGGHGMFGDVHVDIRPMPRGGGFAFNEKIVGGSVPKQYIPAVEAGAREYLDEGPFGFPVVDVSVTLTDGQFHAVDSNEMSFKLAAREAMKEGLPKCGPVLLEPILKVDIDVPSDFTNKVHGLISGRRGQILGFDTRAGWPGWDTVSAMMPQAEIQDLIIELRSLSQGVATFHATFDHLQELSGRLADQVVKSRKGAEAQAS